MTPDPIRAARRLDLGLALGAAGDDAAAAAAFQEAIALNPDGAEALFCLAEAAGRAGDREAAIAGYRRYLAVSADDPLGAGARLALLQDGPPAARMSAAYVRRLFDQYAPRFDAALTGPLGYRGPAVLRAAILAARPELAGAAVLDLGCGTGLAGAALRDLAVRLVGIDLSPGMIARARERGVYDELIVGALEPAMAALPAAIFDLAVAADVLPYIGALEGAFAAVARLLRPGGLLALTAERAEGEGYHLGPRQRFAHAPAYVEAAGAAAGLRTLLLAPDSTRLENGRPVPGLVAVLAAP